ncbi:flagellar protein FlgN [Paenibacillus sp.]|uniref:flagellar protein FlgN n=1 Tax=Paenibacillus sp. TaxID=58172 RepID=UPI002D65EA38|nr:flagellar protein FlgN [Paenibacillus sp.]HZG56547.1 flagellar protein FlgN [Paenibacillus sp.]
MPVQRLLAALTRQSEIHEALFELAGKKRMALVRDDVNEVSALSGKEAKLIRAIQECLSEQSAATNEFFRDKGYQPTRAINVTELSRMITDPALKAQLLSARDKLASIVAKLKQANELNQQLIEQSLAFINYTIDLVVGPDDEPTYHNPAQQRDKLGQHRAGYFDSRA